MLPKECPSCREQLKVRSLRCGSCGTEVNGLFELPPLARLEPGEQEFILRFTACSGSLKEMARLMNLSYPTVRNRLDEIINKIKRL